jgi:hypothetical protein
VLLNIKIQNWIFKLKETFETIEVKPLLSPPGSLKFEALTNFLMITELCSGRGTLPKSPDYQSRVQ